MTSRFVIILKFLILLISVLITVLAMGAAAEWNFGGEVGWILALTLAPYGLFFLVSYLVDRFGVIRGRINAGFVIALLMMAFTIFAYAPPAVASSTDSLIFLFAPFYLLVGSLMIYGITLAVLKLVER